jgi:type II restriction/modification system DNA methylase subunit YeeA
MKLVTQSPKKALKAFLKQKPLRSEIDRFKTHLIALLDKISVIEKGCHDESEEHLKNNIRDFLRDTYYKETNAINTKDKKDLVIHLGKTTDTEVGVIIEAKRPSNINEMLSAENPNKKALHELILYYLDERNKAENIQLKHLIVTNIYEWYIIDANYFDKHIYRNTQIKKLYDTKINDKKDNPFFYEEIAKIIPNLDVDILCVYFDIREYNSILRNDKKEDDRELSALYKILSPQHLLKIATPNDSNSLNERFYKELLHIIGLEEAKEGSKNIIRRKLVNRNPASLIESTIEALITEESLHRITDQSIYGETNEEKVFNVSLELCLTWINRILFLKLLEGQLITYHQGNKDYRFLNTETIHDFGELFKLFHQVLAVNLDGRTDKIKEKFSRIPYLNSSLFEISELEDLTIKINSLDNDGQLELINSTILKEIKKNTDKLPTLDYFFKFLDAYDFASEGTDEIQEDNKTIINASVLGKVFEKINGYKDGSIYTPGFITMYMCKQSIRLAVLEKFNEALTENSVKPFDKFDDIKNYTSRLFKTQDVIKVNEIINSLRICDIAVGSGHFLVSSLNEIISIKAELGILADEQGYTINGYEVEIVNDELIITDREGNIFEYKLLNGKPINKDIQRLQKTLFHEKQTIIENCLFGVDINPNSVKICRLRLWIELLKNAYYKEETSYSELETLPNIDINIKCGNSLISRFALDADLSLALKSISYDVKAYRGFVNDYKNAKEREYKRGLLKILDNIKSNFRTNIDDPFKSKISKARGEVTNVLSELNRKQQWGEKLPKELKDKLENASKKLAQLEAEKEAIINNVIYKNAFEWRFEFPEVLNNNGDFEGFDLVIGNPPYIRHEEIKHLKFQLEKDYSVFNSLADILTYFFELGNNLLKQKGILSFIVSNKFFKASYGDKLRAYLTQNIMLQQIIEFDKVNIFDEATVKVAIIQFKKEQFAKTFTYVDIVEKPEDLEELINEYGQEYQQVLFNSGQWIFQSDEHWNIYHKINKYGTALSDWNLKINRGLLTGLNEAFIINEETKNRLIKEDKSAAKMIKPLFRGREIEKYSANFQNTYLIFIPKGYTIKRNLPKKNPNYVDEPFPRYGNMEYDEAWSWLKNNYSSIAKHLKSFKDSAEKRQDKGDYWWELRACDYYNEFETPKIIWKRIGSKLRFCYDESGTYTLDSTCIATGKYLKYLVGVLNSKLIENELNRFAPKTGTGDLIISVQALTPLQIPIPTEKQEKQMNDLVDKIITLKQQDIDSTENERQVDELVYKLYDITEEEQKIIEGN